MCVEQIGQVVAVEDAESGVVIVAVEGSRRRASVALLQFDGVEVMPGDWLLIHTGLAVRVLGDDEARELVRAHAQMRAHAARSR
ncbi:MAG TPA: HypC/HybG/HupF family hydrogenase formation chaperone [Acidimicrobiales bacterium]|nr:HypC/HybG/HupF family hydrogenase formation chaperone [Acidimicrobiales bacterium]